MSTTPQIKFEDSPAESLADSFTSTPGSYYPSLFANNTMDPIEVMTPQSYEGESTFGGSIRGESVSGDTPAPEKKPVKKRKSWGQQLPEPKTNLPPRYILTIALHHRIIANSPLESGQRPKMRRSNDESNGFSATVVQLNHPENASAKRWKHLRLRSA